MKRPITTILVALSLLALAITALLHAASPAFGPLGLAGVSARGPASVGSPSASAPSVAELGSTPARAPSGPGIAITASSGDGGFGTVYPAASRFVTAVGGTTLSRASNPRGWSETAWSGAGSGCSASESQPAWQAGNPNITSVCSHRAVADASAYADPSTGVCVYDSFAFQGTSGWLVFGGTSVGAPIIASAFALAGGVTASSASDPHAHSSSLFDVVRAATGVWQPALQRWRRLGRASRLGTPDALGAFLMRAASLPG